MASARSFFELALPTTSASNGCVPQVYELHVREALSQLFCYKIKFYAAWKIKPQELISKPANLILNYHNDESRFFHGLISKLRIDRNNPNSYAIEVVPWLWFLQFHSDCQVFQGTVPEIIEKIFENSPITGKFEFKLTRKYRERNYCVQYRETHLNFVQRLLEEEGIAYYFTSDKNGHKFVMFDSVSGYQPSQVVTELDNKISRIDTITNWEHQYQFHTGNYSLVDYNFENPDTSLLTRSEAMPLLAANKNYEIYDIYSGYITSEYGQQLATNYLETQQANYEIISAASSHAELSAGTKFTLKNSQAPPANSKDYLVTEIEHFATDYSHVSDSDTGLTSQSYRNQFHCIPAKVIFRPPRLTPKPISLGYQSAKVVANYYDQAGEEVCTDNYGRVCIEFPWERNPKIPCWARVSQSWAGPQMGVIFNPRVGQEVIVQFEEGNPDKPLIVGCTYNAVNRPPFPLPQFQNISGIITRSIKGGSSDEYNALLFNDTKGNENVTLQAQKNYHRIVKQDEVATIEGAQTINVSGLNTINAAGVVITAENIVLESGANKIEITPQEILVNGVVVKILGQV